MRRVWCAVALLFIIVTTVNAKNELNLTEENSNIVNEPEGYLDFELDELSKNNGEELNTWYSGLLDVFSFSLVYELSAEAEALTNIATNRASIRVKYKDYFRDNFYLYFDVKENIYFKDDYRVADTGDQVETENIVREAYLQTSYESTSVLVGSKILIWGEADRTVVTDVISPRDLSEFVFISIDESRLGQEMLVLDNYFGENNITLFFTPYPKVNTRLYNKSILINETEPSGEEWGLRWKKTIEKSDIALMFANLFPNNPVYKKSTVTTGTQMLDEVYNEYEMLGLAFNLSNNNMLYKGEVAYNNDLNFNGDDYSIYLKPVIDAVIGFDYTTSENAIFSLELFNRHIVNWSSDVAQNRNTTTVNLGWQNKYFNDNLFVSIESVYFKNNKDLYLFLDAGYQYNDNLKLELKVALFDIDEEANDNYLFPVKNRLTTRVIYQF